MYILTVRTDKEEAEIGLYDDNRQLVYKTWQAHRQLAETLHKKIIEVLMAGDIRLHQLDAIVAYKGPGSFTGLRIGLSVANALAYSLNIAVVADEGDDWLTEGIRRVLANQNERIIVPNYGAEPHITAPKH